MDTRLWIFQSRYRSLFLNSRKRNTARMDTVMCHWINFGLWIITWSFTCFYFVLTHFSVGNDIISVFFLTNLQRGWRKNDESNLSQKAKTEARVASVHKQLYGPFISSETPSKTLDPCSSAHIAAHHLACCNFDGKNPYYFDRVWGNWSNESVRCTLL